MIHPVKKTVRVGTTTRLSRCGIRAPRHPAMHRIIPHNGNCSTRHIIFKCPIVWFHLMESIFIIYLHLDAKSIFHMYSFNIYRVSQEHHFRVINWWKRGLCLVQKINPTTALCVRGASPVLLDQSACAALAGTAILGMAASIWWLHEGFWWSCA